MLVREQLQKAGVKDLLFSVQEISDYRQQNNTMSGLVEYHGMRFTLLDNGSAERVRTGASPVLLASGADLDLERAALVEPVVLTILGVRPDD